jgi:hypothetical protein
MGKIFPHRHTRRHPARVCGNAPQSVSAPGGETTERHEQLARERERKAQIESEKQARAAARREQRASDALRANARNRLAARAESLFPWTLLVLDRQIAAVLSGQPPGTLFPLFNLTVLFAGVNCGVAPKELGVAEPAANSWRWPRRERARGPH